MFTEFYLPEFDHAMETTRRMLARVPEAPTHGPTADESR